jgi:hypothetical protein
MIDEDSDEFAAKVALRVAFRNAHFERYPEIRANGEEALRRLLPIAQGYTGQSRKVALFLLGLYNGPRFPFDLTDFRGLDFDIFADCIAVLKMDQILEKEVHRYFANGSAIWEKLAKEWVPDNDVNR